MRASPARMSRRKPAFGGERMMDERHEAQACGMRMQQSRGMAPAASPSISTSACVRQAGEHIVRMLQRRADGVRKARIQRMHRDLPAVVSADPRSSGGHRHNRRSPPAALLE